MVKAMADFAVLCTGPSMSQAVADSVSHLSVVAVNGTFDLAPKAAAIAANDIAWWNAHPEALNHAGRKFSTNLVHGVELIRSDRRIKSSSCSGVLGLEVAKRLGAKRIVLLGADMRGSHYFGDYTKKHLRNATEVQREKHAAQFALWAAENPGLPVFNCTPGSALACFPMGSLADHLPSRLAPTLSSAAS